MIATATAGRSSEQTPHDSISRPLASDAFRSPEPQGNGRTPSISPLSQVSKTHYDSAIAGNARSESPLNRSPPRGGGARARETVTNNQTDQRERSSSLSDIEGSLGEQENEESESEDASTPAADEDRDSEAETERVNPTPQKSGNPGRMSLSTPLKSIIGDGLSDTDSVRASEEPDQARNPIGIAGRKRKRTLLAQDVVVAAQAPDESDSDDALIKKRGRNPARIALQRPDTADQSEEADDPIDDVDPVPTPDARSPSKTSRSSRSRGGIDKKPSLHGQDTVEVEIEDGEEPDVDAEDDNGDSLGPEEADNRNEAVGSLHGLHATYLSMRSRMFGDRIMDAEEELAQLRQTEPSHPLYIRNLQSISERRDTKIQQEMRLLQYKKQALRNLTLGNRSQLLSQYLQEAREIREDILYNLGKQWYDIQKERRGAQAEELVQYTQKFPTKRSEQVRQQAKYNTEVSILSGVAKYVGFPAAPEISSVRANELEDDLKAMKIARKQPLQSYNATNHEVIPHAPVASSAPTSERLAQKEFLEQTPWANPHHPVHAQSRTPSAFGHHGLSSQPTPPYSLLNRPASAFATPLIGTDRHPGEQLPPGSNETIGAISDPPSSVLAAPPTADRIRLIPFEQSGDTSPTSHVKRNPGTKRDFSGLSSASTIDMQPEGPSDNRMAMDITASHQPFLTAGLHAGHSQASHS